MMATDIPAALSAYSMAVAPPSSRANGERIRIMMRNSGGHLTRVRVNQRRASISLHSSLKLSVIPSFRPQERASETRWRPAGTRGSKRTDREIAQPQIGKTALLPDPEQRPIERQPDRVIALFDNNSDAFPAVAAVHVSPPPQRPAIPPI